MNVSHLEWVITVGVTIAVLAFDVVIIARRPHEPTRRECAISLSVYVGLAVAFGLWVWSVYGARYGVEFLTGWLTEYSLSVDNLFVFLLIMAGLRVPARYQQQALMVGIVLALVFRGVFITLGAVAIDRLSWVFYIFGAFLVCTGVRLLVRSNDHDNSMSPAPRLRGSMSPAPRLRGSDNAVAGVRSSPSEHHRHVGRPQAVPP